MVEALQSLRNEAMTACIHLYLGLHVSQMKDKSEEVKKAWSVGQELYLLRQYNDIGE